MVWSPSLGIQSPCQMMIGVYNHLLTKVFRFHYHSQKVIGSMGHLMIRKVTQDIWQITLGPTWPHADSNLIVSRANIKIKWELSWNHNKLIWADSTLQGTNISPTKAPVQPMIFHFLGEICGLVSWRGPPWMMAKRIPSLQEFETKNNESNPIYSRFIHAECLSKCHVYFSVKFLPRLFADKPLTLSILAYLSIQESTSIDW